MNGAAGRGVRRVAVLVAVLVGVAAISSAAVLIRLSEATPLVTAFYRVGISAVLAAVGAVLLGRRGGEGLEGEGRTEGGDGGSVGTRGAGWRWGVVAGVLLGFHFWTWMESLARVPVATSTLLVTTTPLWVALAAPLVERESRLNGAGWAGALVALGGAAWIGWGAERSGSGDGGWTGVALAVLGAWLAAGYFVVARRARGSLGAMELTAVATGAATATLAPFVWAEGSAVSGFSRGGWLVLLGLAVVPQLLGHGSLVYVVRRIGSSGTALLTLMEPVGASALAWWVLGEGATGREIAGGVAVVVGVGLALTSAAAARGERGVAGEERRESR